MNDAKTSECCLHSFYSMGIRDGIRESFEPHKDGDAHRCEICGQLWIVTNGQWQKVSTQ